MPLTCPSCGTENPDRARFCLSCATSLFERAPARQERKFATALFADLVGYTTFAEREDPEVVRSVVERVFDRVTRVVQQHGGVLEKFMGDAVLAVFGVPTAHEDDPERAVRAALDISAAVFDLNEALAAQGRAPIAMRIGIEAGELLVDIHEAGVTRERMLTGDAVNTAARLQQTARAGKIVVGASVYSAAQEAIDFQALPPLTLKGKAALVPAWEAVRVRAGPPGTRSRLGLQARLTGRDEELALLKQTFHRTQTEGRTALVTILGPAGVGKSRLVAELLRHVEGLGRPVIRSGRCLAYGNVSYSALAEAVKSHCRILVDDPPEVVAEKSSRVVRELFGDAGLALQIGTLVGSGEEHSFTREELFDAWRRFLERIASGSSLVLVLEDIHWADQGLLDFIDHVVDWAEGPILVMTLARPELLERQPSWGAGKRNYSAVYLDPLSYEETEMMLEDLLTGRVPASLNRLVVERSEGNPLFAEEIVRVLIERGVLRPVDASSWELAEPLEEVEIPRSIQALIAARLDSLPVDEKTILQDAAVVGRVFWLGTVAHLSGRPPQGARDTLGRLREKEIVIVRDPPTLSGELELAFRHVLIRDVAYESLPKSSRWKKHLEVAGWAEAQAGDRREEIAELLATHYLRSLRYLEELGEPGEQRNEVELRAYRWARSAGDRALRLWEQRAAIRWYRTALDLADRAGASMKELARLWESYARAGEEAEPYHDVARALKIALALYDELGDEADAGRVEARLAYMAHQSGDHETVLARTERALDRLERLGESADLALALHVLGWHEFRNVRYEQAERHLHRAMEMAERVGDGVTRGHAMVSLAFVFQQTARGDECIALFESALDLARQLGDLSLRLRAQLHICGALEEIAGDYRRGEMLVREGLELAGRAGNIGNVAWMEQMLSDLLVDMGRLDEAEEAAWKALEASRRVGEALVVGYALQRIAYLAALRGDPDQAERMLEEARPIVQESAEPWLRGWEPLIEGHIAQGRNRTDEAGRLLLKGARELLDRIFVWGGKSLLLECVRHLARVERSEEAIPFRDRLEVLASFSVPAAAFLAWADGLLEGEPVRARQLLAEAAVLLETLQHGVEHGRCLVDLAEAEGRLGHDPRSTLDRARTILKSSGATLFMWEAEAATAANEHSSSPTPLGGHEA